MSEALKQVAARYAVEVLCECVGLEDALALTERPREQRVQTLSVTGTLSGTFAGPRAGAATITVQSEPGTPPGTLMLVDREPVETGFAGIDYGIALDSPLSTPRIGERRRIEPGSRPLPHGVNLAGMAPGQPSAVGAGGSAGVTAEL